MIHANQTLGIVDKSNRNMPCLETLSELELTSCFNYAQLVKAIAKKKAELIPVELKDLQEEEATGPKTAELPSTEVIPSEHLIQEIDFSDSLNSKQRKELEKVVLKHEQAFGLNGCLGLHDTEVEINLSEGTKEICLAPYSASPAKREVIEKQLQDWKDLGVIEESKSPWGFPVIVVYHNSKPRLSIDYRRLNEVTIPDEYPLPKQTGILHTLEGSQ
jgi:hypothetical protein